MEAVLLNFMRGSWLKLVINYNGRLIDRLTQGFFYKRNIHVDYCWSMHWLSSLICIWLPMNVIGLKLFNRHFLILIACISSSYQFTNIVTVHINLSDKVHAIYLLNQSVPPNITKDMVTFGWNDVCSKRRSCRWTLSQLDHLGLSW
jgi:hypothetical protein